MSEQRFNPTISGIFTAVPRTLKKARVLWKPPTTAHLHANRDERPFLGHKTPSTPFTSMNVTDNHQLIGRNLETSFRYR